MLDGCVALDDFTFLAAQLAKRRTTGHSIGDHQQVFILLGMPRLLKVHLNDGAWHLGVIRGSSILDGLAVPELCRPCRDGRYA